MPKPLLMGRSNRVKPGQPRFRMEGGVDEFHHGISLEAITLTRRPRRLASGRDVRIAGIAPPNQVAIIGRTLPFGTSPGERQGRVVK